ncbi:hypothetical protein ABZ734_01950 [Streptomyces sp. NPDC006660]|uniref:hypothetical protein n=1 Tax=Streptomyces sp. NPDC006660 TaxID=3156901 RepID=UPI0033C957F3
MTHFLDLVHPAAGTALISEWHTGTPERSRAAADAMIGEWAAAEMPSALLAQYIFLSTDGTGLLFYAQWTSDENHLTWVRARRAGMVNRVDTLVPGIVRPGLNRTRLHRSVVHDAEHEPGVFGLSVVATDRADDVATAAPGLLGAHLHLTPDGRRAFVLTEWADAAAQEAADNHAGGSRQYTLHHSFLNDRSHHVLPSEARPTTD